MAVTTDIVHSYRAPSTVVRRLYGLGRSEPWLFTLLTAFLVIAYIASWPGLARAAFLQPEAPLVQRIVAAGLGMIATIPFWYLLAAISCWVLRLCGGQGDYYGARLALFWALLASSPLMLLQGLVAGFIGSGPQAVMVEVVVFGAMMIIWIAGLRVTQFEKDA